MTRELPETESVNRELYNDCEALSTEVVIRES